MLLQHDPTDVAIITRGKALFKTIQGDRPSIFNRNNWTGKVMDWSMQNPRFKTQLLHFIDVFPSLKTEEQLLRSLKEYFGDDQDDVPAVFKWGAENASLGGKLGAKLLSSAIRKNIKTMAQQFIIGEDAHTAIKNITKLRKQGFSCVIDVLGEATIHEEEAEHYVSIYLNLLDALHKEQSRWKPLQSTSHDPLDYGHSPIIQISVKATALYSQCNPMDFEGSVQGILARMRCIYEKVIKLNAFMCIDMESYAYKEIILEVFKRLRSDDAFRAYPHLGLAMQAYLKDTEHDVEQLIHWAEQQQTPFSIRLVKGAYWDYEVIHARQNGWTPPVFTQKPESDIAFECIAKKILQHAAIVRLDCASHNLRSICSVIETAQQLNVPESRYEFQVLYGMAEPIRNALLKETKRVRLYCPYGKMIPGMAYLVRRLLENTANESFLRQSFSDDIDVDKLLENPQHTLNRITETSANTSCTHYNFENEPAVNFAFAENRDAFRTAISKVRKAIGKSIPLYINGQSIDRDNQLQSVNPANPKEVIGHVSLATTSDVDQAVAAATEAFPSWRNTDVNDRVALLRKVAANMRNDIFHFAAWQTLEVGKQWDQAYADVTETIDFLEYYAVEMLRLSVPQQQGHVPGENNQYTYTPKGVVAVIAPWNFPLAISCGMCAAALVTGNTVVFKPSELSSVIAHQLVELFESAGLPKGVFNCLPGIGKEIGDHLVEHAGVSMIAFTGSMQTGLRILEKAAKVQPGQHNIKKVVCEMGGKNAIIVDEDADLDEAIPAILHSAFDYQGQKCSACSRVIVVNSIYATFVERLIAATRCLSMGPAEDPSHALGAVIDTQALDKVKKYQAIAETEGNVLYTSTVPSANTGYYAPTMIVDGIEPHHQIAQDEVFGPLLAIMRVEDFNQAIDWANRTRFGLSGAVFSRSPKHLERARAEFRVGNLYLNRGSTGALVERQPFGATAMSGAGSKAGGPDYLLHFMDPRTVTENTMRRGFDAE